MALSSKIKGPNYGAPLVALPRSQYTAISKTLAKENQTSQKHDCKVVWEVSCATGDLCYMVPAL